MKVIETKSEYRFFYNESLQGLNKRSSIKVKNVSIDKILSILLDYTEIEYKLNKKNLVILFAKIKVNKKINGLVFNKIFDPIIGASIPIKGSKEGIIKDTNGNFSIDININSALIISFIGCKINEYTIEQKKYSYWNRKTPNNYEYKNHNYDSSRITT